MKYVLPLVVLAIAVGGFAYFTLFSTPAPAVIEPSRTDSVTVSNDAPPPASNERTAFTGEGTLYSLLTRGDNAECAITYIPNPVEPSMTGNVFTFDGNLRGDFVVPTPDLSGEMVSSIIIAKDTIWQWTTIDDQTVGSVQPANFSVSALERLAAPIGFAAEVQYNCLTWQQPDYTIFEAPSSVLFTDVSTATFEEGTIYSEDES